MTDNWLHQGLHSRCFGDRSSESADVHGASKGNGHDSMIRERPNRSRVVYSSRLSMYPIVVLCRDQQHMLCTERDLFSVLLDCFVSSGARSCKWHVSHGSSITQLGRDKSGLRIMLERIALHTATDLGVCPKSTAQNCLKKNVYTISALMNRGQLFCDAFDLAPRYTLLDLVYPFELREIM